MGWVGWGQVWDPAIRMLFRGAVAQLGERGLCKPEVVGSIPISSTTVCPTDLPSTVPSGRPAPDKPAASGL